ncbi:MAG: hypothetical protein P0Y66_05720 [Candidatus Kaistia colombiensis]|nr:MAG: hypothetical protein P0Y66_05720 [Kaistia sp.]
MIRKIPDHQRDIAKAKGRDAIPLRWKDAPRAIARTLVYAGIIAASILLWSAIGRLFIG